jgi:anaerobic nitric oxide reductase flavorubredoxin
LEECQITNKPLSLSRDVYWVGINDNQTPLFEGLWNIPEGVSYNSYLVKGSQKTALIDCVGEKNVQEHFEKISQIIDISKIDYLIINHMEQDHTSGIPELLNRAPNIKIVYTPLAQSIFRKFYQINPDVTLVKGDDMTISLGDKTLHFIQTPWLHWPETMSTYCPEEKILFCCDVFGAFKTLPQEAIKDSDIDLDKQNVCGCSQKYFASVFNAQREWVIKALEKFKKMNLEIEVLAPSHGPVLAKTAKETLDRWTAWSSGTYQKIVVIAYASMYGFTAKALGAIADGIAQVGGTVKSFNLSETAPVDVLTALVEAPALIIGVPTYEHEIFPKVADFINLLRVKKFTGRYAGVFGSFGWSGEATKKATSELTALGLEIVGEPLQIYGSPTGQDLEKARQLGKAIAEKAFSQKATS